MAAKRAVARDKNMCEGLETGDNLVQKRSILAGQTCQSVNSELNLSFLLPVNLASSSAVKDVFQQDAPKESLPSRHSCALFLGDARAGKTSLEKHLLDKSFDPTEEATKGLEFDVVQTDVTEVNEGQWQAVNEGPYSRYNTGRAQYVALEVLRQTKTVVNGPLFLRPTVMALLNYGLAIAVIMMFLWSVGFQFGFGVALLLKMGIFKLFGQSYDVAKAYGISISLTHVICDYFIRYCSFRSIFLSFGDEQSVGYPYLQYIMFTIAIVGITFISVVPWPVGGRPGISLAFCLMSAPAQLSFGDVASNLQNVDRSYHICLLTAAIFVGVVASSSGCLIAAFLVLLPTMWSVTKVVVDVSEMMDYMLSLVGGFASGVIGYSSYYITQKIFTSHRLGLQLQVFMGPICFVYGIGLSWLFGWKLVLPSSWKDAYYIVPNIIAIILIVQVERQRVYWATQELGSYPAFLVGRSIKALKQVKDLPLKFTLIDFAGDAIYHCTHHLFLSHHAIHLIVFNMERLEQEPDYIRRICNWVQSVTVHVQNPHPHIFIVGTHANSLPVERRKSLSGKVSKVLLSNERFTQSIVGKPDSTNNVVFCVENSIPIRQDPQARLLQKNIMEVASSSFHCQRNIPIKWLKLSDFVSKYKSSSNDTCLLQKRQLFDKLRQEGIVEAEEEGEAFEEMLKFYDEIGEIKVMGEVVVLNMKALVQLVIKLVEFDYDDDELGIVHINALRRVWKFLTAEDFLSTIALLERYDLLCPISQEQYLVPLLLKTFEENTSMRGSEVETDNGVPPFWNCTESDTVLYFKFYKFHPEAVFLRLLARCLSISQKTHDLGRGDVYRNVGRFYQGHDFYFKVELVCQSVEQNMIMVTAKCAPNRQSHSLLSRLHNDLQQIRHRDFPYLKYTVGLPCPACSSSYNREEDGGCSPLHILRVAGHDQELPRPGERVTLMCRGKAFEADLGKQQPTLDVPREMKTAKNRQTAEEQSVNALLNSTTIRHLSILLDPPAPIFGNNWRALADELGLCFQDICYIETRQNPTEMVLQMYAANTQAPNVQQIHRALLDTDRPDAAAVLEPSV